MKSSGMKMYMSKTWVVFVCALVCCFLWGRDVYKRQVLGTVLSIFLMTMTGYVLSRKDFPWKNGFSFFFFFTTLFNGGLVPWYLLCTQTFQFNNKLYALIIPGLFSVWNMIIAKSFMKGIPYEMVEAAKVCLLYTSWVCPCPC